MRSPHLKNLTFRTRLSASYSPRKVRICRTAQPQGVRSASEIVENGQQFSLNDAPCASPYVQAPVDFLLFEPRRRHYAGRQEGPIGSKLL